MRNILLALLLITGTAAFAMDESIEITDSPHYGKIISIPKSIVKRAAESNLPGNFEVAGHNYRLKAHVEKGIDGEMFFENRDPKITMSSFDNSHWKYIVERDSVYDEDPNSPTYGMPIEGGGVLVVVEVDKIN